MLTLSRKLFDSLCGLLFPSHCLICGARIKSGRQVICLRCHLDIPFTLFINNPENKMTERMRNLLPHIVHVSALVYHIEGDVWRALIHRLKYKGEPHLGKPMGRLLGIELRNSPIYSDIDFVIPIPLHPIRRVTRGYNQSEYIAREVAHQLGVPMRTDLLRRKHYNVSQVNFGRMERWDNAANIFEVVKPQELRERNILIIDDVFTTGATTLSCSEAIIDAAPSCRIWISTLSVSEQEFGMEPIGI